MERHTFASLNHMTKGHMIKVSKDLSGYSIYTNIEGTTAQHTIATALTAREAYYAILASQTVESAR